MRSTITAATAALLLVVAFTGSASAQGYPSVSQAQQFAAQGNIHGQCGKTHGVCQHNAMYGWYIVCYNKRGLHSRDCDPVEWYETDYAGFNSWGCYGHYWVRLEADGRLTFHVDYGPRCS
jgi:hypothetical protein